MTSRQARAAAPEIDITSAGVALRTARLRMRDWPRIWTASARHELASFIEALGADRDRAESLAARALRALTESTAALDAARAALAANKRSREG